MNRIDQLFDNLDAWRHLPSYQLERRADAFFSIYLARILETKYGEEIEGLIPEFPVRIGTLQPDLETNQSFKIDYLAKTTFINWDQIGKRWAEFENGTIGNDRFPPYTLNFVPISLDRFPLEDGISTDAKMAWVEPISSVNGSNIDWSVNVFRDGTKLKWNADGTYDLEPGANNLGVLVQAKVNNIP